MYSESLLTPHATFLALRTFDRLMPPLYNKLLHIIKIIYVTIHFRLIDLIATSHFEACKQTIFMKGF